MKLAQFTHFRVKSGNGNPARVKFLTFCCVGCAFTGVQGRRSSICGDLVGMHGNLEDNDNMVGLFQAILRRREEMEPRDTLVTPGVTEVLLASTTAV